MNRVEIRPGGPLKGKIRVPADKSITHRAVLFGGIAHGESRLRNPLRGEDCLRSVDVLQHMGVRIEDRGKEFVIHGRGLHGLREPGNVLDCGNSGTTARLTCGLLSGQDFFSVLTGDDSLRNRPMARVTEPLRSMGARFMGRDGGRKLPLAIRGGGLKALDYVLPVASAQVKTAVLLAGLNAEGETTVTEPEKSRDHTERMLRAMGAAIREDGLSVTVQGGTGLNGLDLTVPGDFSSAAFFLVAATLVPGSELTIENVGVNPSRTGLLELLREMGASVRLENERQVSGEPVADLFVSHSPLSGIAISGAQVVRAIDEFPILCVAASMATGETQISGAAELRVKESDRIATMVSGLRAMGVEAEERPDGMQILGRQNLSAGSFQSHGDHRVAMSMSVAGLCARGTSIIEGTECVATSFPGFWDLLRSVQRNSA